MKNFVIFFTWFSSADEDEVIDSKTDSESDGIASSVIELATSSVMELAVLSEELRVFLLLSYEYPWLLFLGPPFSL